MDQPTNVDCIVAVSLVQCIHIGVGVEGQMAIIGSTQTVYGNLSTAVGSSSAVSEDMCPEPQQQIAQLLEALETVTCKHK